MFRYEWYKIRHNIRLLCFLLALLVLNSLYFCYSAERKTPAAHTYRALTEDFSGYEDADAAEKLSAMKQELTDAMYMLTDSKVSTNYPKYSENLFAERELYAFKIAEYDDVLTYQEFVSKAAGAAQEYRLIFQILGGDGRNLAEMEKTSRAYEALKGIQVRNTHSKAVSEAVSLPSLLFFEILTAVLIVAVLFTKDKEQGLLRLYSSMKEGRGRMFLSRIGAVSLGCAVTNLFFFLSTILTGCLLYGMPCKGFLTEPLQSLAGYRQAILKINIGSFLLLVYLWSVFISVVVAAVTAVISALVSSAIKVYVILFSFVGIEGILYLNIDDLSYLAGWKRINLVSFANPGYTIARYRNEFLFGKPVAYPLFALLILAIVLLVFGVLGWWLSEKGFGVNPKKGRRFRLLKRRGKEHFVPGCHTRLTLHEGAKFLHFEKIGYILLILTAILLFSTKPYQKHYSSLEEMFYQSFLYRLAEYEPEQYGEGIRIFREELEEERANASSGNVFSFKESALQKTEEYAAYLRDKEGARIVDSRGYERLYNNRKQNVELGLCGVLAAILCGTAMLAMEYRTGMAEQIRISPKKRSVYWRKGLILLGTVTMFFILIYGRYLYQLLAGYGTKGIGLPAYSIMDWSGFPAFCSIGGGIAVVLLKRYCGVLLCTAVAVFLTSRLKNFLLTAIVSLVVLAVPLLLCLKETDALTHLLFNWFFL